MSERELKEGMTVTINPRDDKTRKKRITGVISEILTSNRSHPHGILVKLSTGELGRVKESLESGVGISQDLEDKVELAQGAKPNLKEIAGSDETELLEFKESLLWSKFLTKEDIAKGSGEVKKYGQDTSRIIAAKTMAAFLNTNGGTLAIGIKENKNEHKNEIVGIDSDLEKIKDRCEDGFRRLLVDSVVETYFPHNIFQHFSDYISINFERDEEKLVCIVYVKPSDEKVFLKIKNETLFMIRVDASNRRLEGERLVDYCAKRYKT